MKAPAQPPGYGVKRVDWDRETLIVSLPGGRRLLISFDTSNVVCDGCGNPVKWYALPDCYADYTLLVVSTGYEIVAIELPPEISDDKDVELDVVVFLHQSISEAIEHARSFMRECLRDPEAGPDFVERMIREMVASIKQ